VAALADRLTAADPDPGRLDQVAEVYLEVTQMDSADVLAAVASTVSSERDSSVELPERLAGRHD
jgi:hypothetical protein